MKGFKQNFENFLKDKSENKEFEDSRYKLEREAEAEILDIQAEKEKLVETMHELLEKVDNNEEVSFEKNGRSISEKDGKMYFYKKGGVPEEATKGDIMVSGINGFNLKLDAGVDRSIKKEYILRETRRRIRSLYDQQLIKAEIGNLNRHYTDRSIEAYRGIEERADLGAYESKQPGILAETMVESYMTKMFIDNPELPFSLEAVDVYDDVRNKMDFKLHIKKEYTRGVNIDTHNDTGIQFTLNKDKEDFKKEQIERAKKNMRHLDNKPVDDLVLVSMSLDEVRSSLEEWKSEGKNKSIAGPAEHWNENTKKNVFVKMLEQLPDLLAIKPEELWEDIQNKN